MSANGSMQAPLATSVRLKESSKGRWRFLWPGFPVNLLVDDQRMQRWAPKLIWLVIPLEYYVITRFSGGFSVASYLSVVIFSVVCVFTFLITGFVSAALLPFGGTLQTRCRGMVASLLCVWGAALLLLASSYFLTCLFGAQHEPKDLFATFFHDRFPVPNPHGVDRESVFVNFAGYFGYALLATVIDAFLIRVIARPDPAPSSPDGRKAEWIYEPGLLTVSVLVALLMLLLHALTIAQFTTLLNSAFAMAFNLF